jgi:hypothetical protein
MGHEGLPVSSVVSEHRREIDHLLDTVATFTHRLFHRAALAFMDVPDDHPLALHRALEKMLYDMAGAPETTYLATVELPRLGPLVYERHTQMLDLFCELLTPASAELEHPPPDRDTVFLCITGGVWETVRRYALDRRLDQLPHALPTISYVCLSTLFGQAEAQRVGALARRTLAA